MDETPIANFDHLPWEERLGFVQDMMKEVSLQTRPQAMVEVYGRWMARIFPADGYVTLSRRDLLSPWYRVTRSSVWEGAGREVNPWRDRDQLPLLDNGFLGDLIYGEKAVILNDFPIEKSDPGYEYLSGFRALVALPMYENGVSINMVVRLSRTPYTRDALEKLPQNVWTANLFGRATKNLVLSEELRQAYELVDRELKVVADIQRSLLPSKLPSVPGLDIAAYYQTSTQSGGDYYDFFEIDGGKIGFLIADVSGHGTPAAVMMAVTHSIAHTHDGPPTPPSNLLNFINRRLAARYTNNGTFVTAFYGIYDPSTQVITYCNAGHNPPRVRRSCGTQTIALDENRNLPLGILDDETYTDASCQLNAGDVLVFYTDGITEARATRAGELFGTDRLDALVKDCASGTARDYVNRTIDAVNEFSNYSPAHDDRTLVIVKVA